MFCLRTRLNLDLSPFIADIMSSRHFGLVVERRDKRHSGCRVAMTVTSRVKPHVFGCKRVRWNRIVKCSGMTAGASSASQSLNHEGAGSRSIFGVKQFEYTLFVSVVLRRGMSTMVPCCTTGGRYRNPLIRVRIPGRGCCRIALLNMDRSEPSEKSLLIAPIPSRMSVYVSPNRT